MHAHFIHAIASNIPVDLGRLMFNLILEASLDNSSRAILPFGFLITKFFKSHMIEPDPHETHLLMGNPISQKTLWLSNAHLGVAPFSWLRSNAIEIIPSNDEAPLPTKDVLSASTDPSAAAPTTDVPSIAVAIAALVAHMDGIHKDLVELIGQIHEQVDRITERQELDIKVVQDTLSALSQHHSEFITDVNDFIQSICRQ